MHDVPVRITRKFVVEQAKDALHRGLVRGDIAVRHYRYTPAARKRRALEVTGVQTLLDVGANKGQAGRLYRRHGFTGRIVSFEPDPAAVEVLRGWAAKYAPWDVVDCAVGAAPGSMALHVSQESQFNSLRPMTEVTLGNSPHAREVRTVEVEVRTLDDLADHHAPDGVLGLKIDVQGFEEEVLDGGARALARARYVDVELCPVPLYEGQLTMIGLMSRMEAEGFSLIAVEDTYSDLATGQVLSYNGVYARLD